MPTRIPKIPAEVVKELLKKRSEAPLEKRVINSNYEVVISTEEVIATRDLGDSRKMSEDPHFQELMEEHPESGLIAQVAEFTEEQFRLAFKYINKLDFSEGCSHRCFYCFVDSYTEIGEQIPIGFFRFVLNHHPDWFPLSFTHSRHSDAFDYPHLYEFFKLFREKTGRNGGITTNVRLRKGLKDIRRLLDLGVSILISNMDQKSKSIPKKDLDELLYHRKNRLEVSTASMAYDSGYFGLYWNDNDTEKIKRVYDAPHLFLKPSGFYVSFPVEITQNNPQGIIFKRISRDSFYLPYDVNTLLNGVFTRLIYVKDNKWMNLASGSVKVRKIE